MIVSEMPKEQGDYEAAREYLEDSLDIKEELGDRAGIANSLTNLGLVARDHAPARRACAAFSATTMP